MLLRASFIIITILNKYEGCEIMILKGDFIFAPWEDGALKKYNKCILELRKNSYRKINQDNDYLNFYEYYRQKGKKKIVVVTIMSS